MSTRATRIAVAALVGGLSTHASTARAQSSEPALRVHPEVRADLVFAHDRISKQVGAGIQVPAGIYARIGIDGAVGTGFGGAPGIPSGADARVDVLARFLFDPFRQSRWGVSAGAGVTAGVHPGDRVRPGLLVAVDLEGRRSSGGISPAIQVGLGGGVRVGGVLRWGSSRAR